MVMIAFIALNDTIKTSLHKASINYDGSSIISRTSNGEDGLGFNKNKTYDSKQVYP